MKSRLRCTTPIEKLSGAKILDTMENNRSLEKELLEEEVCPVCGGHHDHEHHHQERNVIMSVIMTKNADVSTITEKNVVMNTTTEKNADVSTTMGRKAAMSTTTEKNAAMSTTMTENAAADTTIMTIITTMRMRSSQAGAGRLPKLIRRRKSVRSWRPFPMMRNTA